MGLPFSPENTTHLQTSSGINQTITSVITISASNTQSSSSLSTTSSSIAPGPNAADKASTSASALALAVHSESLKYSATIGLAVGLPLGVLLVSALSFLYGEHKRRIEAEKMARQIIEIFGAQSQDDTGHATYITLQELEQAHENLGELESRGVHEISGRF